MNWKVIEPKQQRKAIILGGLVALGLLILIWPSGFSGSRSRPPLRPKSGPMGAPGQVHAAPPQPAPAPDPLAKLLGHWEGREWMEGRGVCHLVVDLKPGDNRQGFAAASTFGCTGATLPQNSKDPAGILEMMRPALNQTSASFTGAAKAGAIELTATDNIGVSEAAQGCDMASMTLKGFVDGRMSVRWRETGKGVCTGGEMMLAHAR